MRKHTLPRLNKEAARWVKRLGLERHPEGGYFKQTYSTDLVINVKGYDGPRHAATAIYYLLDGSEFAAFHRIKSDEIWHHYAGGPLTIHSIGNDGKLSKIKIGKSMPQVVIKANTWFAASLSGNKKSHCLLGCTVSPGFDYRDWELGKKEELAKTYPQHRKIIEKYAR
jgi:uncharacterized protein